MKKKKNLSFTTRYVLMIGILLLVVNSVLGLVILNESKKAMKSLINKNMLDVVRSAAGTVDGDMLGSLTEDDVDGEEFNEIKRQLTVFFNTVDIKFIYAVKQAGDDRFVFTVDADPEDPAAFGEEVLVTDALRKAGGGTAAADDEPAEDRWGNFYSAYCPVYDSSGNIAGIIGIDYAASWYEAQMRKYTLTIAIFAVLSVVIASVLVFLITNRVRRKFKELDSELSSISATVDTLMDEVGAYSGFEHENKAGRRDDEENVSSDELDVLSDKMRSMQTDLGQYLDYLHGQAFTDALTALGNAAAYRDRTEDIDLRIKEGTASFTAIVFDLNGLKHLNDDLGHKCGDIYLHEAAEVISEVFGLSDTYRIGGDEFAVILEGEKAKDIRERIAQVRAKTGAFAGREDNTYHEELSLAIGYAAYDRDTDRSFNDTFRRADTEMYSDKKHYYELHDRRKGNKQ